MKNIIILGSTGSIGKNTLDVVEQFRDKYKVVGLAAGTNLPLLKEQIEHFRPDIVSVREGMAPSLREILSPDTKVEIVSGPEGLVTVATLPDGEIVVAALVGAVGLLPTLAAIRAGKDIALANKECLVMAGDIMMAEVKARGVKLIPVDSEHSAVFQCLIGHRRIDLNRIILTASGGPFVNYPREEMERITPDMALAHPNWAMGKKVTIDSATLMNKGLEVIEAHHLFDVSVEMIAVYVHPQSIVHALVEYGDGTLIAQLSCPDMKLPISYALSYPERLCVDVRRLSLVEVGKLTFLPPDRKKFPALDLAYQAIREGGGFPVVLNAANEVAVGAFLECRLGFTHIPEITRRVMHKFTQRDLKTLEDVMDCDDWARVKAREVIENL